MNPKNSERYACLCPTPQSRKGNLSGLQKRPLLFIPLALIFIFGLFAFMVTRLAGAHPVSMEAIAEIESSNNPNATGSHGEIGLYQISPIVLKQFNSRPKELIRNEMDYASYDNASVFWSGDYPKTHLFQSKDLFDPRINRRIADFYFDWIHERVGQEIQDIIAWNWGIGNWRKWYLAGANLKKLPKSTQAYLAKYEKLTEEKLS